MTLKSTRIYGIMDTNFSGKIARPRKKIGRDTPPRGLGISRVAALANFSPRVSGFMFKSKGFSGFEICRGLWVWPFNFVGFSKLYHP